MQWKLATRCSLGAAVVASFLFVPTTAAQEGERTESAPSDPLDSRNLRALYLDLLGRPPFQAEREEWRGKQFDALVSHLLGTEEFWRAWLEEELYYFLLVDNFRPTSERVLELPTKLAERKLGVRDALHRIVLSASFDRRNPGPDTFVTVVMEQLLGVTVQKRPRDLEIGKRIYDGAQGNFLGKKGNSQADVVSICIQDKGALRHFLTREYQRLLRAPPGSKDLSGWVRSLGKDELAYADILEEWLLSEAYQARLETLEPLPNRAYIHALFIDLTGTLPTEDEARRMRNALDGLADAGPLRSVLARLLIDSGNADIPSRQEIPDPTAWIAGMFERFLGRAASQEELKVFVTAFHEPSCRPETVVYAIVSHPEYQSW